MFDADFVQRVRAGIERYWSLRRRGDLEFVLGCQLPWHHYSRLSVELSQTIVRSPFLDNELVELLRSAPDAMTFGVETQLRLIADGNAALGSFRTDRGLQHRQPILAGKISNSLRELTFKAEYAYDYGMPDWLTRLDRLTGFLRIENQFLGKHKFYHFRTWYRHGLSSYVKAVLLDRQSLTRPYLNAGQVERIVTDHLSGRANRTMEIHRLLSTELTVRTLLE
jgi:asparagine synthase (glutamine-hydrolysing)